MRPALWRWRPDPLRSADDEVEHAATEPAVIYCVVPHALADELHDKLTAYYADDDNVTVIVERREADRRASGTGGGGKRETRDRRRPRVPGELPDTGAA